MHRLVPHSTCLLLVQGGGVSEGCRLDYSVHSFRAFLASALLAAKVPRALIMRMLRWRSEASLEVYARLSDAEWGANVEASRAALVDASVATRLNHDLSGLAPLLRLRVGGEAGAAAPAAIT